MVNNLEKQLQQKTLESGNFDFQGFCLQAFRQGKKICDLRQGKTYEFYDIASLTKIVFTTSVFIKLVEDGELTLKTSVKKLLPWYKYPGVKIGELLNHSAGNEWWQAFYKDIDPKLSIEERYTQLQIFIRSAPIKRRRKTVYSDIDFYLLGAILEKIFNKPLLWIWKDYKSTLMPRSEFHFNDNNRSERPLKMYAPTEICPWRNKVMRGEVHDENAWAMGGVAPHAGLFGRIEDLSSWGLELRKMWLGKSSFVKASSLRPFVSRSLPTSRGDWGYGFMIPSPKSSSAGSLLSKKSFGHTGFTGTSLWYDPTRDLLVCLLSNRVHPSRKNQGFIRLRPQLHDWIVQYLEGKR
ncbi:MAG: serine hydrolase [Bdellovibrionales bacterium]|nr:serine hydrolase [Bdellovibrionales bacterium]